MLAMRSASSMNAVFCRDDCRTSRERRGDASFPKAFLNAARLLFRRVRPLVDSSYWREAVREVVPSMRSYSSSSLESCAYALAMTSGGV